MIDFLWWLVVNVVTVWLKTAVIIWLLVMLSGCPVVPRRER